MESNSKDVSREFLTRFSLDDKKLGKGGSGIVMRGRHLASGKPVAIKIINPAKRTSAERARKLFEREVLMHKAVSGMDGVVRFIDSSPPTSTGCCYLATELAPMGDLFCILNKRDTLHENDVRSMTLKLVKAVGSLHRINMVHRDIKPENILMLNYTKPGRLDDAVIKLADFGHADFMPRSGKKLFTRDCGTAGYRAPELQREWTKGHGLAADMWSVGVVMNDLFDFKPVQPFPGDELFWRKPVWKSVSPEAKNLLGRLLTPCPRQRFTCEQALQHPWLKEASDKFGGGASNVAPKPDSVPTVRERRVELIEPQKDRCYFPVLAPENARANEAVETKPQITLSGLGRFRGTARPQTAVVATGSDQPTPSHVICSGPDVKKDLPFVFCESVCSKVKVDFGVLAGNSLATREDRSSIVILDDSSIDGSGGSGAGKGGLEHPPASAGTSPWTPEIRSSMMLLDESSIDGSGAPGGGKGGLEHPPALASISPSTQEGWSSFVLLDESNSDSSGGPGGGKGGIEHPPASADFRADPSAAEANKEPVSGLLELVGDGLNPTEDNWNLLGSDLIRDWSRLSGKSDGPSIDKCNDKSSDLGNIHSILGSAGACSGGTREGVKSYSAGLEGKGVGSDAARNDLGADRNLQDSSNSSNLKGKRLRADAGADDVATLRDSTNVNFEAEVPPYKRRANLEDASSK